jgi:hypothetical protein
MNFDDLKQIWNGPLNQWPAEGQQLLARHFAKELARRRRFQAVWLGWTFLALAGITFLALRAMASHRVDLELEWVLFPLLLVPWAFAFHFLRRFLEGRSGAPRGVLSVTDALRAALQSNRSAQRRLKLMGILFALMVPMLALAMRQLQLAGKASLSEVISMGVLFAGVLALSAAGMAARLFVRLRPQQRRLESLLVEIDRSETV